MERTNEAAGNRRDDPGFLRAIARLAEDLAAVSSIQGLGPAIDRMVTGFLHVEYSGFFLLDPGGHTLKTVFCRGFTPEEERVAAATAWERHPGHVVRTGQVLHVPDTDADPEFRTMDSPRRVRARSRLYVPILIEGRAVGTIGLASARPHAFDEFARDVLNYAANLVAVVYGRLEADVLRQAEQQRLQAVVTDQTELICRFRPDGVLTFVNNAYCRYFGLTCDRLVGQAFSPMVVEEDLPTLRGAIESLGPDRPVVTYEHRVRLADGRVRWQQWTDRALYDPDGTLREIQSVGRDINDLMEAQRAAADSEAHFRQIADQGGSIFYLVQWEEPRRILHVSAAVQPILGLASAEVVADPEVFFGRIHPDDQALYRDRVRDVLLAGKSGETEYRFLRPDGSVRWLRDRAFPVNVGTGEPLRTAGFAQDITLERAAFRLLAIERDLAGNLARAGSLDMALGCVLDAALGIDGIDCGGVYGVAADGSLDLLAHRGLSGPFVEATRHYAADSVNARIVAAGQSLLVPTGAANPGGFVSGVTEAEGIRALLATPVRREDRVVAVLNLGSRSSTTLPAYDIAAVETIAAQIAGMLDRIEAQSGMEQGRRNLMTLFDGIDDFLFVLDMDGVIRQVNAAVHQHLGWSDDDLLGRNFLMLHPERHRAEALRIVGDMLSGLCVVCPLPILARDGREIPVDTKVSIGVWDGRDALFGISRDMTVVREAEDRLLKARDGLELAVLERTEELKRANVQLKREVTVRRGVERQLRKHQAALRELSSDASLAEERERRRIATEVHDRLGQVLSLGRIRLDMLRSELPDNVEPARFNDLDELLERAIEDVHNLTFELSPPILYEVGFHAAVEWLAEDVARRAGLDHELDLSTGGRELPFDLKVLLFQVVRELLLNVVKHAGARSFRVAMRETGGRVLLTVTDDGQGLLTGASGSAKSRKGGFGLFSIRERLTHLGGRLTLEAAAERGTQVVVEVPLPTGRDYRRKRHDSSPAGR